MIPPNPKKSYFLPLIKFFAFLEFISYLKKFYIITRIYEHPALYFFRMVLLPKKQKVVKFVDGSTTSGISVKTFYSTAIAKNASLLRNRLWSCRFLGIDVKLYTVDPLGPQIEVFQKDEYGFLEVENKQVLDIGANIGDTTLYFLLKSARIVIAIEPYPANCDIIRSNLETNLVDEKRAVVLNCGVGPSGQISISTEILNPGACERISSTQGKIIDIVPLSNITSMYNIEHGVLKMDCEGCEYDALLDAGCDTLQCFDQMQIEYHYGPRILIEKLQSCGFFVSYTPPKFVPNINVDRSMTLRGYIYATKK